VNTKFDFKFLLFFQVLQDVTKEEFIFIMEILKSLSSMNTVMGRQQLLEIVTEQAELDQTFEVGIIIV
jgi:hypothetical protein